MLIAYIYEVLPLLCPLFEGQISIIAFITRSAGIRIIFGHMDAETEPLCDEAHAAFGEGV